MPTYEYECAACGARFEQFQRMSDAPIKVCPECGESSAHRLMSTGVGVVFKGHGFYVTDYRDASYAKAESAEKSSANSTKSEPKKSESKKVESTTTAKTTTTKTDSTNKTN